MENNENNYIIFEQFDDYQLQFLQSPFVTLQVNRTIDGSLEYILISQDDHTPKSWKLPKHHVPSNVSVWKTLNSILASLTELSKDDDRYRESVYQQLQGIGQVLLTDFLFSFLEGDESLLDLIQRWPLGAVIQLESNEHWIPWELMFDGTEFWGSKFVIARKPSIPGIEYFAAVCRQSNLSDRVHLTQVVNVIGGGFKANVNRSRIRNLFSSVKDKAQIEILERPDLYVSDLAKAAKNADLLHLTCHGHLNPELCLQLGTSHLSQNRFNASSNLTLASVINFSDMPHAIVFANACYSGTPTEFLGHVRTFGWAFYSKGVDAYIGTLGTVPTQHAIEFAEQFYKVLLKDHATVGEALHQAKRTISHNNPFWLLYCLYGDPFAKKAINIHSKITSNA